MPKRYRIEKLIKIVYLVSLFLFELILGVGNIENTIKICLEKDYYSPLNIFTPFIIATITYFKAIIVVAIITIFIPNIDKKYKKMIYALPLWTLILWLPISLASTIFANAFHLYGIGN